MNELKQWRVFHDVNNEIVGFFDGHLSREERQISFDFGNFLLRGSSLRITESVVLLVVFTGRHCKIFQAKPNTSPKISELKIQIFRLMIYMFAIMIVLCLANTFFNSRVRTVVAAEEMSLLERAQKLLFIFLTWILNMKLVNKPDDSDQSFAVY